MIKALDVILEFDENIFYLLEDIRYKKKGIFTSDNSKKKSILLTEIKRCL